MKKHLHGVVLGAALALVAGTAMAQDRPREDRGRSEDQGRRADDRDQRDREQRDRDQRDQHDDGRRANDRDREGGRADYHFRAEDREHFSPYYQKDVRQWREHPDRRHQIRAGERLPGDVHLKSVPQSYYRTLPPPPPGYRFGYYNGYVVAYNPATQVVADVLDLVDAAAHR